MDSELAIIVKADGTINLFQRIASLTPEEAMKLAQSLQERANQATQTKKIHVATMVPKKS